MKIMQHTFQIVPFGEIGHDIGRYGGAISYALYNCTCISIKYEGHVHTHIRAGIAIIVKLKANHKSPYQHPDCS